jgi:hypothetical protein
LLLAVAAAVARPGLLGPARRGFHRAGLLNR